MDYWANGNMPQANRTINKHSWQRTWNNFHMQTHFWNHEHRNEWCKEQHMDVVDTYYMDSSEQYIAQNVEWWTGWNAQWKFTEVSGWDSQQQYTGLMSTVETLSNGNASMQNEDIYIIGMNATIPDKQLKREAHDNWNYFCVTHLMILWMALGQSYEYWIRHRTVKYDTGQSKVCITHSFHETYTSRGHVFSLFHFTTWNTCLWNHYD